MEKSELILCDTNIFIEFYRGNRRIIDKLKDIGQENIALSVITAAELLFGALNKKELKQIWTDLNHLTIFHINTFISKRFLELMIKYSLSHKLTIPDAIIAATAIENNIPLFTLNIKDFRFIENLELFTL